MTELTCREKKKYAVINGKMEAGIWGQDLNCVKDVELTTRAGHRDTWEDMLHDNQQLKYLLRKREDIYYESIFSSEVTPLARAYVAKGGVEKRTVGGLIHLHGFAKLDKPMKAVDLHSILSPLWKHCHGAPVVWVKDLYNFEGAKKYNIKHAVKDAYVAGQFGRRLLMSRGWLPVGYRAFMKLMVRWYLQHRYDIEEGSYIPFSYGSYSLEYVPYAREVLNDYIWRWCNGEVIHLDFGDGVYAIVHRDKIYEKGVENGFL